MAEMHKYGLSNQPPDIPQILQEAQNRWLRPTEICQILSNYKKFSIAPEPPNRPPSGSLFLFDRKILRYFRRDGHIWRKKKDGKTVKEAHEKLKVGSVDVLHCYYAHGEENENFQRRTYWLLEEGFMNIVLVHYLDIKGGKQSYSRTKEAEDIARFSNDDSPACSNSLASQSQVASQTMDAESPYSGQISEYEDAETDNCRASSRYHPFVEMQQPVDGVLMDNLLGVPAPSTSINNLGYQNEKQATTTTTSNNFVTHHGIASVFNEARAGAGAGLRSDSKTGLDSVHFSEPFPEYPTGFMEPTLHSSVATMGSNNLDGNSHLETLMTEALYTNNLTQKEADALSAAGMTSSQMSSETESQAVVPVAVDMDVEMANGGAADGEVQAAAADTGNGTGDVVVVEASERGQEDDGKVNASDVVKEGEKKEPRNKMAARSEMWKHFEKIMVDGKLQKGKCNYCNIDIAAHPVINGTSALGKHFRACKHNPHKNIHDDKQAVLHNSGDSVHTWKFDPEAIREAFIRMMIEDELPFAFGGKSGFRKFMAVACPRFLIPSRRTCTRDTVRTFFEEKAKLKLFLREHCERVSLTTDCWTSQQQESFMTVTAHFICKEWKLHKKIISFSKVKGHKGDDIGKHLQKILIDWGVEKVMTITVDNASSNDGGISYMKKELNKAKTSIAEGKYLHMRCAAHIVNLIVTDGLKEVELSIKRVRAAVRYVKNSPERITNFKECAGLEKVETKAFLNLDVSTRWNSTYYMLQAAVSYDTVFPRYTDEDPYFAIDLLSDKGREKGVGVPDENDLENARKMADFLGHFADLTTRVSASLHVTANSFFHEIGEVNLLVKSWMDSDDGMQKAMAQRMKDKYDKYWGNWYEPDPSKKGKEKENINLMIFIGASLDPRYKLSEYMQFAILEMYGDDKGPKVWAAVNTCLRDLFEEYRLMYAPSVESAQASDIVEAEASGGRARLMRSLIAKKMRLNSGGSSSSKSEIDKFLAEEPEDDSPKFDILSWWKVNSSRFPILACLARDVLAIPISTVASESAFSTGGRVLDDFRTSLTPFMVEALVCTQDWIRHDTHIDIAENTEELTKLEQELIAEYKANKAKPTKPTTSKKPT